MGKLSQKQLFALVLVFILNLRSYFSQTNAESGRSSIKTHDPLWKEHWEDRIQNLSLRFTTDYIVFFKDSDLILNPSEAIVITVPQTLSSGFFLKLNTSTLHPSTRVYVQMSEIKYRRLAHHDKPTTVPFALNQNTSIEHFLKLKDKQPHDRSYNLEHQVDNDTQTDANLIIEITHNTTNLISDWKVHRIIAYSRLIQDGRVNDAYSFKAKFTKKTSHYPQGNLKLFADWYLPIYEQYGQSETIQNFLKVLQFSYSNTNGTVNKSQKILPGEFVHLWSQAANTDLRDLAHKAFGWIPDYRKQFEVARKKWSFFNYTDIYPNVSLYEPPRYWQEDWENHRSNLTQVFSDEHAAFYFDASIPKTLTGYFNIVSNAWSYVKSAYSIARPDPRLYIILHNGVLLEYWHSKQSSYLNKAYNNRLVWDCIGAADDPWDIYRIGAERFIIEMGVAGSLVRIAKETGNSPVIELQPDVAGIFAYDIYLGVGELEAADKYKSKKLKKRQSFMGKRIYWFRDWYYPIYSQYGKTKVLNKFLSLLHDYWPRRGADFTKRMKMRDFVNFWSGAAGADLSDLATKAFGVILADNSSLAEANAEQANLNYTCYGCDNNLNNTSSTDSQTDTLVTGISAGFASVLIIVVISALCLYRQKVNKLKQQIRELTNDEIDEFYEGNSNLGDGDGNSSIESKPFNKDYELPRDDLEIDFDHVLGSGEFGLVVRGQLKATSGDGESTEVAVKTVKPNVNVQCFKALLTELKVMCYLGVHTNIALLLGALTVNIRKREVYIAVEFCARGDLHKFLRNNRSNFTDFFPRTSLQNTGLADVETESVDPCKKQDDESKSNYIVAEVEVAIERSEEFSTLNLLEWASHVAEGMAYIASKNVIHGDLAARNILLSANNVAKISDFGLSRQLMNYSNYMKTSKTPVPWRWMAIESLRDMEFSVKSDTWAFGVTLYEIFSLGTTPYAGWTWDYEFVEKLVAGHRLSEPEFGSEEIYKIMMDCMKTNPEERATLTDLILRLEATKNMLLVEAGMESSYIFP